VRAVPGGDNDLGQIRTPERIAKRLQRLLNQRLSGLTDKRAIFECHREIFEDLVVLFGRRGNPIRTIKRGYDELINQLMKATDGREGIRDSGVEAELERRRNKISAKIERSLQKITTARQVRTDLMQDLAKLEKTVPNKRRELQMKESTIFERRQFIEEMEEECKRTEAAINARIHKLESIRQNIAEMEIQKVELDGKNTDILKKIYDLAEESKMVKLETDSIRAESHNNILNNQKLMEQHAALIESVEKGNLEAGTIFDDAAHLELENDRVQAVINMLRAPKFK
jgi:chromosome segregation ATPase